MLGTGRPESSGPGTTPSPSVTFGASCSQKQRDRPATVPRGLAGKTETVGPHFDCTGVAQVDSCHSDI